MWSRTKKHFLFECCFNEELRFIFNSRVSQLYPQYQYLDSNQKLVFLFEIENEQLITWVRKFLYNSFCLREEYHGKRGYSGNSNHILYNVYRLLNRFLYLMPYGIIPPVDYHKTTGSDNDPCVTICTVDSILCMYDFVCWLHYYLMPCFHICIPCFYHVCILWNMPCQKWRNKQATTTTNSGLSIMGYISWPNESRVLIQHKDVLLVWNPIMERKRP